MHYTEINWAKATIDDVYDYVDKISDYTAFLDFCKFIYKNHQDLGVDWVDLLFEYISDLSIANRGQVLRQFVPWYAGVNPDYLANDYPYFEEQLVNEYFYHEDIENITQRLSIVKQNPVAAVDHLSINVFFQLLYYGFYNQAIDYGKAVYYPIENSDKVWIKANRYFLPAFYFETLQHAYLAFKQTGKLDTSKVFELAKDYELDQEPAVFERELFALQNDLDTSAILNELKSRSDDVLHKTLGEITVHFSKYMLETYQVPFSLSVYLISFVYATKLLGKSKSRSFFYFTENSFDKFITSKVDFAFGSNMVIVFGQIWGLQYVYEFLEKYGLISAVDASLMNKLIASIRKHFVNLAGNYLWEYNYIFKWPKHEQWVDLKPEFDLTYTQKPDAGEMDDLFDDDLFVDDDFEDMFDEEIEDFEDSLLSINQKPIVKTELDKIGRNDPCPCGSGKKYKKCCGTN